MNEGLDTIAQALEAAEAMAASAKESVRKAIAKKVVDHRKTTKGPAPKRG